MGGLSDRDKARLFPVFKPTRVRDWWELARDGWVAPPEIKTHVRLVEEQRLLLRAKRAAEQGDTKLAKKLVARATS